MRHFKLTLLYSKMIRLALTFFWIFHFAVSYSQDNNQLLIGQTDSVVSKVLNETRELYISLPANYNSKKKYPVVFLLDGEIHFHFFTGIVQHWNNNSVISEMIVGIVNTNRNRDLTPTHDASSFDPSNGGGETFTLFIEKELVP